MVKEDDRNNGLDVELHKTQLNKFNEINKCHFVKTLLFDHISNNSGFAVCFIPSFKNLDENSEQTATTAEDTRLILFENNPSDLELPVDTVCFFFECIRGRLQIT